jgi:DNA polymerase-1
MALVGEQPGTREVRLKEPFIGPAGDELNDQLRLSKIPRRGCYITNVIKDLEKPLQAYINLGEKVPIVSDMGREYIRLLKKELEMCGANIIVAVGAVALFALADRIGIYKWRASVIESTLVPGRKMISILHPATVIEPKNVYLNKHLNVMDLRKAKIESEYPEFRSIERKVHIKSSFHEVMEFLRACYAYGMKGITVDYDIELYNEELGAISFSIDPKEAISIPFVDSTGDYFTPDQEAKIMLAIEHILSNPKIVKRGQYIIFDSHFLLRKYGIRTHNMDDTMVAQKILFPDYPVGLDFSTAMYSDIPYYKEDGKIWLPGGSGGWEQGWIYNGYDSLVLGDIGPKQKADLERQENVETYERQKRLIPPLTYMMERGIKVDVEGMMKENEVYEEKIEKLNKELEEKVGKPINPNSPPQLVQYFYIDEGLPAYRSGGKPTVNEDALKRIFRKGYDEARIVLDIRGLVKRKGTYLNPRKVDPDGRLRCAYNPVGTRYSRISSAKNIFGTGTNMQNWPHELLKFLLIDDGYVGYFFDLSQIENRIVAYVGEIPQMIEAFENGIDVHKMTAALIFGKPIDEVTTKDGTCYLSGGRFSERYWGKKANHAFNYDLGYKSFALRYEIPENEGKWIHSQYHRMYPGVKENYHAMVKAQLGKNRTLTNLLGRKTLFLDKWPDRRTGEKLFREAYSCIPQGTCGDVINERGVNYIYYNQQDFKPIELLIQVHDSVGFQIPLSVPWKEHAEMLTKIKKSLEQPLKWKNREFVIPTDLVIGLNFHKESGVEIKAADFPTSTEALAKTIESTYGKLRR